MPDAPPVPTHALLLPGDPAPWFQQRATSNPRYTFDSIAGRHVLLAFVGSAASPAGRQAMAWVGAQRGRFDDQHLSLFGVSVDPQDEAEGRLQADLPGIRHFWDADGLVSRLYGALPRVPQPGVAEPYRACWVLLSPNLQVRSVLPMRGQGAELPALTMQLDALPPVDRWAGPATHAPVLQVPDVFEPAFCARLIAEYERAGGAPSGFMRDRDGKTVGVHDAGFKVRRDCTLQDEALRQDALRRIARRLVPMIRRAYAFDATRMERYLVACYDGLDGGHFRPHRDNTTRGTAHRRFAVTINLNDGYVGGDLSFPEYGPQRYRPPPGGAVVFSCALLHGVDPVREGRRYAFLPFLYDEAAAAVRAANADALAPAEGEGPTGPSPAVS